MVCVLQLRFLVQWGLGELEEAVSHTGAFTLLRAIIGRRIVLPEVYDVVSRIQECMIRSQARASHAPGLLLHGMNLQSILHTAQTKGTHCHCANRGGSCKAAVRHTGTGY